MLKTAHSTPLLQEIAISLPSMISPDRLLSEIWPIWEETIRQLAQLDTKTHLEIFQPKLAPMAEHFIFVQHIALYMGEYSSLDQIEYLDSWFTKERESGSLLSYEMGPSHIAPRYYLTPGWWFAFTFSDGTEAELFTCLDRREWISRSIAERASLMSHAALTLTPGLGLDDWATLISNNTNCKCIHSSTEDTLGHTYSHWLNPDNNLVLEVLEHEHILAS